VSEEHGRKFVEDILYRETWIATSGICIRVCGFPLSQDRRKLTTKERQITSRDQEEGIV
jgi:hypothetical protein